MDDMIIIIIDYFSLVCLFFYLIPLNTLLWSLFKAIYFSLILLTEYANIIALTYLIISLWKPILELSILPYPLSTLPSLDEIFNTINDSLILPYPIRYLFFSSPFHSNYYDKYYFIYLFHVFLYQVLFMINS